MKFYSDIPNLHIIRQRDRGNGTEPYELCVFDENGELETEDKEVIRQLRNIYRHDEPKSEEAPHLEEETKEENNATDDKVEEEKIYQCKKCEYTTTNKGELMQHYKKMHKKGE